VVPGRATGETPRPILPAPDLETLNPNGERARQRSQSGVDVQAVNKSVLRRKRHVLAELMRVPAYRREQAVPVIDDGARTIGIVRVRQGYRAPKSSVGRRCIAPATADVREVANTLIISMAILPIMIHRLRRA